MKKIVEIVTIPIDKKGFSEGDICKCINPLISDDTEGEICIATHTSEVSSDHWQAHQLLVLSDDEVSIGDIGKIVKYPWGIGKTIEHEGNLGIEVECIKCTLTDNPYNVTDGSKARFSDIDVDEIIASYPQIEGTLPISREFVQEYVRCQGKGVIYMEMKEKEIAKYIDNDCSFGYIIEVPKLDNGNVILSIEEVVKSSIPTDEEIEKKAEQSAIEWWTSEPDSETDKFFTEEFNEVKEKWAKQDYCCGYEDGYAQALKDLYE